MRLQVRPLLSVLRRLVLATPRASPERMYLRRVIDTLVSEHDRGAYP